MIDKPATKSQASMPSRKRGKPATPSRAKRGDLTADADGTPSAATIRQAIEELELNRPDYPCRVVGNRLEFSLYGGDVVHWPPKPAAKPKQVQARKKRS